MTRITLVAASVAGTAIAVIVFAIWNFGQDASLDDELRPPPATVKPFDLSNCVVSEKYLVKSDAGRDGIAALDLPRFVTGDEAVQLHGTDRVIGVIIDGQARAYPVAIMERHEIVNDQIGSEAIAVTYCPLCDSAAAFLRAADGQTLRFSVSGYLLNSNLVMYDRLTESLWSQLDGTSVSGPLAGRKLNSVPVQLTTWSDWNDRHPKSHVLSYQNTDSFSYSFSPYHHYRIAAETVFPLQHSNDRFPPFTPVLGLRSGATTYVLRIPIDPSLNPQARATIPLGSSKVGIIIDSDSRSCRVTDCPRDVDVVYSYWFAWYAFHPATDVFEWPHAQANPDDQQADR